jgi:hypothetical protein
MLLRLLVEEQSQMPGSQEHLENGERRLADVRARLERQRHLVAGLTLEERTASQAILLLDTLQRIQALLETHCRRLRDDLGRRPP